MKVGVRHHGFLLVLHESQSKVGVERYRCLKLAQSQIFPLQHLAKFSTFSTFDLQTFFLAFVLLFGPWNLFKHTSMVAQLSIPYPVDPALARIPMRLHFDPFAQFFTFFHKNLYNET